MTMKNISKNYENATDLIETDPYNNNQQAGIYLSLDWQDETADVITKYRDGSTSFAVYHNLIDLIRLPDNVDAKTIHDTITDLLPRLDIILAGFSNDWEDGHMTDDAADGFNSLVYDIEEDRIIRTHDGGLYDAADWFVDTPDEITATTTDDEITTIASDHQFYASCDNVVIRGGLESIINHFLSLRDKLQTNDKDNS